MENEELKNEDLEQPTEEQIVQTNNAENVDSKKIYGNFATVEALVKAYTSLQGEYTRKSQELALLNANKGSVSVTEKIAPEKDEIIRDYLMSIAKGEAAPAVITASSDFAFGIKTEPKSIAETEKIAENYFRNKGEIKL